MGTLALELREIPRPALFLAAKACAQYRRRGGSKLQVPPDFFVGAHAAVEGWPLLTRDASRFKTYFPTLDVLAPRRATSGATG
jgi:predicted nucleic acid-binding protein